MLRRGTFERRKPGSMQQCSKAEVGSVIIEQSQDPWRPNELFEEASRSECERSEGASKKLSNSRSGLARISTWNAGTCAAVKLPTREGCKGGMESERMLNRQLEPG